MKWVKEQHGKIAFPNKNAFFKLNDVFAVDSMPETLCQLLLNYHKFFIPIWVSLIP